MPRMSKLAAPIAKPAKAPSARAAPKVPVAVEEAFGRLERARFELDRFEQDNHKMIRQLENLRQEARSALEDAKQVYVDHRDALGPSYNGFYVSRRRHVDANLLAKLYPDAIPHMDFKLGIAEFDDLVVEGKIPRQIADEVEVVSEAVYSPKK